MKTQFAVGIAAAVFACNAAIPIAQADDGTGWYVGANLGRSDLKIDGTDLDQVFADQGLTTTATLDKHHSAYSLNLGYQANPYFAVEGGYVDLGKHSVSADVSAPAADTLGGSFRARGYDLSAVGILPIDAGWGIYGKAGVFRAKTSLDVNSTGAVAVSGGSSHDTKPTYGVGVSYDFTRQIAGQLEWDRFHDVGDRDVTGRGNVNLVTLGVAYHF